ncbi:twin-arginine translocation pathway signal sequence domain-containing protein [Burkholderia pseudomallei]|nr:twin-arginine translocation pathway signal sequence domain-containing protein [Burkholderia pseudomallei]
MKRRDFLALASLAGAAGVSLPVPYAFAAAPGETSATGAMGAVGAAARAARYSNLLILVELKGGNDGLNTVIPYANPLYRTLRPAIGVKREQVVQLDERAALHPALEPLMPIWRDGRLAIVEGVGYPQPNLSHFRSIEIWDTASRANEYLREGWLTRAFAQASVPPGFAADGIVLGSAEMGPLANGARAIALVNPAQFARAARLAQPVSLRERNPALAHVIDIENDIVKAADRLRPHAGTPALATAFPGGPFGASVKTAMQVLAACDTPQRTPAPGQGVAVLRLTLNGFDTHQNQPGQQAGLLGQLAQGLVAMRSALIELGRWNDTLVMTYAEFGRRARENRSNGTITARPRRIS